MRAAVESLRDASEEDAATGGPDPVRGIYPSMVVITSEGCSHVPQDEVRAAYEELIGGGSA